MTKKELMKAIKEDKRKDAAPRWRDMGNGVRIHCPLVVFELWQKEQKGLEA